MLRSLVDFSVFCVHFFIWVRLLNVKCNTGNSAVEKFCWCILGCCMLYSVVCHGCNTNISVSLRFINVNVKFQDFLQISITTFNQPMVWTYFFVVCGLFLPVVSISCFMSSDVNTVSLSVSTCFGT